MKVESKNNREVEFTVSMTVDELAKYSAAVNTLLANMPKDVNLDPIFTLKNLMVAAWNNVAIAPSDE
jgi:hypothetical protein